MFMKKRTVAIVGATGVAGQQFVAALQEHPWLEIRAYAGSERSAGKLYGDALKDDRSKALGWWAGPVPADRFLNIRVQNSGSFDAASVDLVFSAIDTDAARALEPRWARTTPVVSTASAFRMESDVPLLIPGINNGHLPLLERQRENRGWKGYVLPIPNCTTTGMAVTLKPLDMAFGVEAVIMTSMQAVSGAGRRGGVLALDALENVIPYISGEEEKVQRETLKILGRLSGNKIADASAKVSCTCTRVGVLDGHTETVFVGLKKKASVEAVKKAMRAWGSRENAGLPSAPEHMIHVSEDPFHPQPRVDRDTEDGMATVVGRVREDAVLKNGIKYVLLSHNTKMGAAKGAVLLAELLIKKGYL
jgi:aspartate-semialdehyde dehydrogenase